MRTLTSFIASAAFATAAFASMGATDCGQIISDSGFDLWCGPNLCKWQVEAGEIRKVATWHEADAGVELLGSEAKISQLTDVTNFDGTCVRFKMVADLDESVDLRLQMDVWGDGTYEYDERIPASDWRALSYLVRMPATYDHVRFRLYKRGTGKAVLANIGAEIADDLDCTTPPLVVTAPATAVPITASSDGLSLGLTPSYRSIGPGEERRFRSPTDRSRLALLGAGATWSPVAATDH